MFKNYKHRHLKKKKYIQTAAEEQQQIVAKKQLEFISNNFQIENEHTSEVIVFIWKKKWKSRLRLHCQLKMSFQCIERYARSYQVFNGILDL